MARAFRDDTGTIHFISANSITYQSLGPTLTSLVHSCEAAFVSTKILLAGLLDSRICWIAVKRPPTRAQDEG
jgi:hypothetical protein